MHDNNIWLTVHYASNQTPMHVIRPWLQAQGWSLDPQAPLSAGTWAKLGIAYKTEHQGAQSRLEWDRFSGAVETLGWGLSYSGAEPPSEVQESTSEDKGKPEKRVEARSRMVGQRVRQLQWTPVGLKGVPFSPLHFGDVGVDLASAIGVECPPGEVTYVPTGVAFAAPPNTWILLVGRSSLASKLGLGCVPGVIDNGYRGEMLAGVFPIGDESIWVPKDTRLVQAILMPAIYPLLMAVTELPPSARGENGFGSTGGHQ